MRKNAEKNEAVKVSACPLTCCSATREMCLAGGLGASLAPDLFVSIHLFWWAHKRDTRRCSSLLITISFPFFLVIHFFFRESTSRSHKFLIIYTFGGTEGTGKEERETSRGNWLGWSDFQNIFRFLSWRSHIHRYILEDVWPPGLPSPRLLLFLLDTAHQATSRFRYFSHSTLDDIS